MGGKGLTKVIRGSECLYKNAPRNLLTQRRTFASSAVCQRNGSLPHFSPTSSPELDELLTRYRTKLFFPAHLSEDDKRLIYRTKRSSTLLQEDVMVTIGKEEHRLEPVSVKEEPHRVRGFNRVLELMKERKDWDIIPQFLEGHRDCKRELPEYLLEKLIRKAAAAGRLDVIIECARRVDYTGFSLEKPILATKLFNKIWSKAFESNWDTKETKQALSWAETVAYMLEDPRHGGGRTMKENDPRALPENIGVLLDLAAVRAVRHLGGKDVDGLVATYASRLAGVKEYPLDGSLQQVDVWKKAEIQGEKYTADFFRNLGKNDWLVAATPIIHGMKTALKVLDPNTTPPYKLRERLLPLQQQADKYVEELGEANAVSRRGVRIYKLALDSRQV